MKHCSPDPGAEPGVPAGARRAADPRPDGAPTACAERRGVLLALCLAAAGGRGRVAALGGTGAIGAVATLLGLPAPVRAEVSPRPPGVAGGSPGPGARADARGPSRRVEPFTAAAWAALKAELPAPTVVVFTSTDCAHCPAVLERLAVQRRGRRTAAGPLPRLVAVVMDVAPGEADADLLANPHHRDCDRLFAFDGPATALRFAVNPAWRGVTPYLAVLRPGRAPRWVTGPPTGADLEGWGGPP